MLAKRIIPCLDVANGSVVKGVQFRNHEIIGDIIPLAEKYAKQDGTYTVLAFRRDELMSFEVKAAGSELTEVELKVEDQAKAEKWLKA